MPTQTISFGAAQNQVLTVKLFTPGSDTVVATAAATAAVNAAGEYTANFNDLTAGLYLLCAYNAAGTRVARWYVRTVASNGTYLAFENPDAGAVTAERMGFLDRVVLATNANQREVAIAGGHMPSVVHEIQPDVISDTSISAAAVTKLQQNLSTAADQLAIKVVTDRINTGLVQDGGVYQFTANMLELSPTGGGGGSATVENQQAILTHLTQMKGAGWSTGDNLAAITDLVAAGIGSALASLGFTTGTITGFPSTLRVRDSYTLEVNRAISVYVRDSQGTPITQVGTKTFADADFKPSCVITQDGQSGRVEAVVTWIPPAAGAEGYLRIEIPANKSAYARAGVASVQVVLQWTGVTFTLATQSVTWLPAV